MEGKPEVEMTKVDVFDVPEDEAKVFAADREECALAAMKVMEAYCPVVKREIQDSVEGEAVVSYFQNGEEAFKVLLDPFEVPVMKTAMARGKLKEYIFAANGLTDEMVEYLKNLPKED